MGMFDYVAVHVPLPDGRVIHEPVWQSKDGPCDMGVVEITAEGRLVFEDAHTETVPEHERPYYGKPEWKEKDSIFRLAGCMKRVVDRKVDQNHHGYFWFYDYHDDTKQMEEYRAKFTDGQLVEIERIK